MKRMTLTSMMILMISLLAIAANAQDVNPVECPGDGAGNLSETISNRGHRGGRK